MASAIAANCQIPQREAEDANRLGRLRRRGQMRDLFGRLGRGLRN